MIALMNGIKTGLALSELAIFRQPGLSSHTQEDLFEYPVRALGQTGVLPRQQESMALYVL